MDSFWTEVKRNPTGYRFLVAFLVVWGLGMLWGALAVVGYLRKRGAALRILRRLGFQAAANNPVLLEAIKQCCLRSVYRDLGQQVEPDPRPELIKTTTGAKFLRLSYHTTAALDDLPRPVGLKEQIQVRNRTVALTKLHYRSTGPGEAFYAEIVDSKSVHHFQPRTETTSTKGWTFCIATERPDQPSLTVHRKFSGAAGVLTNLAFRLAQVQPVAPEGLLPEFAEVFDVSLRQFAGEKPRLEESVQRRLLVDADSFEGDVRLVLDPAGVWLNGSVWPSPASFNRLVALCESLATT